MHKLFIVALKLREISMCTITNKFRKRVVERAFIQEIKALMSNLISNMQTCSESLCQTMEESSTIPKCRHLAW